MILGGEMPREPMVKHLSELVVFGAGRRPYSGDVGNGNASDDGGVSVLDGGAVLGRTVR
jgi:hypothetical protein